jgi:CheY-like chemotaxis protein
MSSATLKDPEVKTATGQPGPAVPAGSMRVAIVEDDLSQAELLSHWLELAGHHCHHYDRGEGLMRALDQESFDVLVLDWNLPDISGVDVLKRIRASRQASLPILFVTARNREDDVVMALRQGADDYMVKPVRRLELIARLEAIARRGKHRTEQQEILELDVYRVDCQTRTVMRYMTGGAHGKRLRSFGAVPAQCRAVAVAGPSPGERMGAERRSHFTHARHARQPHPQQARADARERMAARSRVSVRLSVGTARYGDPAHAAQQRPLIRTS